MKRVRPTVTDWWTRIQGRFTEGEARLAGDGSDPAGGPYSLSALRARFTTLDRTQLATAARRSRQALVLAAITGVATGLTVAAFEWITADVALEFVFGLPTAVQAGVPLVGLLVAAGCLRAAGRNVGPSTADDYIRVFHEPGGRLDLRLVPARVAGAIATLGTGNPLGYEGPSVYTGAAIGSALQRRLPRWFGPDESKMLLVAGAAAGVSAIFKAPLTGLVFALEVPYQEDLARRMLLPAAIGSAASYVAFAAVAGTEPILPVSGQPPFNLVDLGGAALIGVVAGILARLFVTIIRRAKRLSSRGHPLVRIAAAGAVLGAAAVLGQVLGGSELALGPGYRALRWSLDPENSVWVVAALGTIRVAGTAAAVGGGGVGGLFIPLVIQGALVGRAVGGLFDSESASLFPVIGMAAFLGAGYRVPLAAVVFVAEFTGRPGFVIPGLIAAVVAQLMMGRASVSPYQVARRLAPLEQRLQLPISAVTDTETRTVPSDATVEELFWHHLLGHGGRSVAVVDGEDYRGLVGATDIADLDQGAWASTAVADVLRPDAPVASPTWLLADAVRAMDDADLDRLAVCDGGRYIGVISADDLVGLDQLIDRMGAKPLDGPGGA